MVHSQGIFIQDVILRLLGGNAIHLVKRLGALVVHDELIVARADDLEFRASIDLMLFF